MSEYSDRLTSIATTIADYREAELPAPTADHVHRWVTQFDHDFQLAILRELDHVLSSTYISRGKAVTFLETVCTHRKLAGGNLCSFWKQVNFLDIQRGGASQKQMLALFSKILEAQCGLSIQQCGGRSNIFVYLDDAIFSGARACSDLAAWVQNDAPVNAMLHVITIATHRGCYYHRRNLEERIRASGKSIEITWWRSLELEDRKAYTADSDVLRPSAIPDDQLVQDYVETFQHPVNLRRGQSIGAMKLFSTSEGRHVLEQELLKAGVRIRRMCPNLHTYQRPLGNMVLETLGFGSLIVTFRNCPNNTPLALWAGDPWYPLFPRITNTDTSLQKFVAMLEARGA